MDIEYPGGSLWPSFGVFKIHGKGIACGDF